MLARRYLELHGEIADHDTMIAAIVDELALNPIERNSIGHYGAVQFLNVRNSISCHSIFFNGTAPAGEISEN